MRRVWLSIVPAFLVLLTSAGEARAGVLATAVRENFPTSVTTTPTFLPLTDAGATSLSFSTASTQTVVITYNGDCSSANPGGAIVGVAIYVDGVAAPGTSTSYSRMCADGPYAAHSRTVAITVSSGSHTVRVQGAIIGSGTGGLLRTVLTVMN